MPVKKASFKRKSFSITVSDTIGKVSAKAFIPAAPMCVMALAHGAGAGMDHSFMESLATALAERQILCVRYNFPFTEQGKKRPDGPAVAQKTIAAAMDKIHTLYPQLPVVAAGKSFGGRMTSHLLATNPPNFVTGGVFYGFPLHAPGKPGKERADHLKQIKLPMLFLQGTKDTLANHALISEVCKKLKLATLHTIEGADHSFKVKKMVCIDELADVTASWCS